MFGKKCKTNFVSIFISPVATSEGQIQPTCEFVTRPTGDGSKGRRLLVFQTYARKRAASNVVDGDVNCKETIMIGKMK